MCLGNPDFSLNDCCEDFESLYEIGPFLAGQPGEGSLAQGTAAQNLSLVCHCDSSQLWSRVGQQWPMDRTVVSASASLSLNTLAEVSNFALRCKLWLVPFEWDYPTDSCCWWCPVLWVLKVLIHQRSNIKIQVKKPFWSPGAEARLPVGSCLQWNCTLGLVAQDAGAGFQLCRRRLIGGWRRCMNVPYAHHAKTNSPASVRSSWTV